MATNEPVSVSPNVLSLKSILKRALFLCHKGFVLLSIIELVTLTVAIIVVLCFGNLLVGYFPSIEAGSIKNLTTAPAGEAKAFLGWCGAVIFFGVLLRLWIFAAMLLVFDDLSNERETSEFAHYLNDALSKMGSLIKFNLAFLPWIIGGYLLFILPGIYFSFVGCAASIAVVLKGSPYKEAKEIGRQVTKRTLFLWGMSSFIILLIEIIWNAIIHQFDGGFIGLLNQVRIAHAFPQIAQRFSEWMFGYPIKLMYFAVSFVIFNHQTNISKKTVLE